MKRTAMFLSMLVLLLSVALVSCDAMFTTNAFAKITHPKPSASDIASKTPDQLQTYTASATNLQQLKDDSTLKEEALKNLATYYAPATGTVDAKQPEVQTAAIVAADIIIKTNPEAAVLSGSILSYVAQEGSSFKAPDSTSGITSLVENILPASITDSLAPGAAMPATFLDMITAFSDANAAYQTLGAGVAGSGGATPAYADGTSVSTSEASAIAVNALVSGLISAIQPNDASGVPIANPTPDQIASALWTALSDPTTVDPAVTPAADQPITFDPAAFNDIIGTGSAPGNIANLVMAAGLDSLFPKTTTTGGI